MFTDDKIERLEKRTSRADLKLHELEEAQIQTHKRFLRVWHDISIMRWLVMGLAGYVVVLTSVVLALAVAVWG